MTFVASCVQPAGISTSCCSNMSLPLSSLIWALRSSQLTLSNGSARSCGQNCGSTRKPLASSRTGSTFGLGRTGATRERGEETDAISVSSFLVGECPASLARRASQDERGLPHANLLYNLSLYKIGPPTGPK